MGSRVPDITVLVTGFGPFRADYPINPSWEIAKDLPEYLPALRAKGANARRAGAMDIPTVRIKVHPEPIRVNYKVVRALVPRLWDGDGDGNVNDDNGGSGGGGGDNGGSGSSSSSSSRSPDIVLHIGMAGPTHSYQIERRGHRQGYKTPDVDGNLLEDEKEGGHGEDWVWYGLPDELETELDMVDVLERWKRYVPDPSKVRISDDAGRYLCDFIYYSSLAHRWRQGKSRRVTFLHVPSDASSEMVEKGRELAIGLIRSLVESEVTRRRGVELAKRREEGGGGGGGGREGESGWW